MVKFKGAHLAKQSILTCVRWYVAYPLSYRQVEEMMQQRGMAVNHPATDRKRQLEGEAEQGLTATEQFYSLAA